jgi:hypothetical protein
MYSFRPCVKRVGATCAAMLLVALATDTARSQQEPGNASQALANWLDCEDCAQGELDAVTHHGQAIVPSLIEALNQGPSPAALDALRKALAERYGQLVEQSNKNARAPIAVSRDRFVELYGGTWDAQHRMRAAQALAAIGGERARAALDASARQAERDDVRAAVTKLLTVMKDRN